MSEAIYGYFPGGDPRDFTPDFEVCSPEEIANWRRDCEAWNRGEQTHSVKFGHEEIVPGVLAHNSGYGVGVYCARPDWDEFPAALR
jgi:hypothetical protein